MTPVSNWKALELPAVAVCGTLSTFFQVTVVTEPVSELKA
jgi:hypothetical protein